MSNIIRTSGKVALPVLIVFGLIAALIGVQYFARSAPRPGQNPAGLDGDEGGGTKGGTNNQPTPTLATFNIASPASGNLRGHIHLWNLFCSSK